MTSVFIADVTSDPPVANSELPDTGHENLDETSMYYITEFI